MNRLGFRHDNIERTIPEFADGGELAFDAVYTHFATADDPEHPAFFEQSARFNEACARLEQLGIAPARRHAANSAALLRDARVWYDYVRPGLLLYGIVPPPLAATLPLRPALSLHSRIVAVKGLRAGEASGYGLKTPVDGPRDDRDRPGRLRRWARPAPRWPRAHARARPSCADRRLGLHGHVDDRRDRHGRCPRRRCGDRWQSAGRRNGHEGNGVGNRDDSLRIAVPRWQPDPAGVPDSSPEGRSYDEVIANERGE